MRSRFWMLLIVIGAVAPAPTPAQSADLASGAPAPEAVRGGAVSQARQALGFEVGEERRYMMGPPEALRPGEAAWWLIRLEEIEGEGDDRRARFLLQHRRDAPRNIEGLPLAGDVVAAQIEAELVVNAEGAPLELIFTSQRRIRYAGPPAGPGALSGGDEAFEVTYRHDGDSYRKEVRFPGIDWSIDVVIPEALEVDRRRPAGWFVYAPATIGCIEWTVADDANAEACNELNTDPAFANPGLLSFLQPTLWEEAGDTEIVSMSPTRPDLQPRATDRVPVTFAPIIPRAPGARGGGGLLNAVSVPGLDFVSSLFRSRTTGDEDRARDPARYFRPGRMHYTERGSFDVGGRTMEGLSLSMADYPGAAYVDDDGKVLRVDINPGAPEAERRWLRLLRASEY